MAINLETLFDLQGLAGLESRIPPNVARNIPTGPGGLLQNLRNVVTQQPQLGPDEFGSYVIPPSDPTYSTGFQYARSIAGGIPMSQVIAPGVSYSPEQPGGYTQAQLNTLVGTAPVETPPPPPPVQEPDIPSFLGTGIGGVRIPVDRDMKMPPLRDIFGGFQIPSMKPDIQPITPPVQTPPAIDIDAIRQQITESGIDFGNLLGIPKYEAPDLSQFVRREDVPSLIPDVPTGRDFSIEDIQQGLNLPDFSQFARQEDIPTIPSREDFLSIAREGIDIPQYQTPDLSGFARLEDIPSFDPNVLKQDILMSLPQQQIPDISKFVTQDDISKAIAGIDMPTYQAPDLSAYDTRLAELEQQLASLNQPTGGRFSVDQQLPMGLF